MSIKLDIDNRKLNKIFKENGKAFGPVPEAFSMVALRHDIADYIREARIDIAMRCNMDEKEAALFVDAILDETISEEVL